MPSKRATKSKRDINTTSSTKLPRRKCAAEGCKVQFFPVREWQIYHDPKCSDRERHRKQRELFRVMKESMANGSGMVATVAAPARQPPAPATRSVTKRIRNLPRVHPRSLEQQ